ncbi:DUF362 domain-containing protein [Pseudomonas bharatica]|uniref:DUF362 domain-containing protein n=1 Tax=Pseudomonas bharatica TaxID=2692112 RepID=UPI003B28A290
MAYVVTEECIYSQSCVPECPVSCIFLAEDRAVIDPVACLDCGECVGHCPVDAIVQGSSASAADLKFNKAESAKLKPK